MKKPTRSTFLKSLDRALIARRKQEGPREHLGFSEIGNPDERYLWLNFRWCMPPIKDPRLLRIFDNGNKVEELLAEWTQLTPSVTLVTRDDDGNQFRFTELGDHLGGSLDGAVVGVPEYREDWMVWEAKSANDNRFKALKQVGKGSYEHASWEDLQSGGLRAWSPEYYAQAISYMGLTGMKRAMVLVYDKNTSELHAEFLEADEQEFQACISKAERIITAPEPPTAYYSSPSDWRCKLRMNEEERAIYWSERLPPAPNCRNCRFSTPLVDGPGARWHCRYHNNLCGGVEQQLKGCGYHQWIPGLMPARLLDFDAVSGTDPLKYITPEGQEFINGPADDGSEFSSEELVTLAKSEFQLLSDTFFMQARANLGAKLRADEDTVELAEEDIPF